MFGDFVRKSAWGAQADAYESLGGRVQLHLGGFPHVFETRQAQIKEAESQGFDAPDSDVLEKALKATRGREVGERFDVIDVDSQEL